MHAFQGAEVYHEAVHETEWNMSSDDDDEDEDPELSANTQEGLSELRHLDIQM